MADKVEIIITAKDEASGPIGGVRGALGGLVGGLGHLAVGAGLAVFGVSQIGGALKGFVSDALESQQVTAQTNAVIASTGGAAGVTADQVGQLADSLSKVTPVDDEVIQSAENMLLTFTNIGSSVFPKATETALDMAQALGEDSKSAAMQLGKALNDPIQGVTALQRVGVKLTDQQKDQVKAMVEAGDVAGAQGVILQELSKEFGGSARAAGQTLGGQLAILKTQLGNVKETIGLAVIPILIRLAQIAIPLVQLGIQKLGVWLPIIMGWFGRLATMLKGPLVAGFQAALGFIRGFVAYLRGDWLGGMNGMQSSLNRVFGGETATKIVVFASLIGDKLRSAFNFLGTALGFVREHFETIKRVIGDLLTVAGGPVAAMLRGMVQGFGENGLAGILPGAIAGLKRFGEALLDLGQIALDALSQVDWSAVGQAILDGLGTAIGGLASLATSVDWGAVAGAIVDGIVAGFQVVADFGSRFAGWALGQLESIDWSAVAGSIITGIVNGFTAVVDFGTRWGAWAIGQFQSVDWSGLATSIINGVVAGFTAVVDFGSRFVGWVQTQVTGVDWSGVAGSIMAGISGALAGAQAGAGAAGGGIMSALLGQGIDIQPLLDQLGQLMTAIQPVVDIVQTNLVAAWDSLKHSFDGVGVSLQGLQPMWEQLKPILETLGTIIGVALAAYVIALSAELRALAAIFGAVLIPAINIGIAALTSIFAAINTVIQVVKDVVKIVTDLFHGDWSAAWSDAKQLVSDMVAGVEAILSGFPAVVAGYFVDLAGQVLGSLSGLAADAGGAVAGMAGDVEGKIGDLVGSVQGFFSDMVNTVKGTVSGWVGDVVQSAIDLYTQFTTEIGSLYTAVTTKISSMVTDAVSFIEGLPGRAVGALGDLSGALYQAGADLVQGFINGMGSLAGAVLQKAKDVIQAPIDWITDHGNSPWPVMIESGRDMILGFTIGMTDKQQSALKAATDIANSIIQTFTALLDFGDRLSQGFTLPAIAQIAAFNQSVSDLVTSFAATADTFKAHAVKAAKDFAESAKSVVALVKDGADAMAALVDFVRPSDQAIADFKFAIEKLVTSFADSGQLMSVDAAASAKLFSDAATAAVAVLKDGLAGLSGLVDFVRPSDSAIAAFKFAVERLVRSIADSGAVFTTDGLNAATAFGTAAQAVVGMLKDGVDGFTALIDFVQPSDHAIAAFKFALEDLVRSIADSAATFSADGLAAATAFADAAKPIVDLISGGLSAFAALSSGPLAHGWQGNLTAFGTFVKAVVKRIAAIAVQFKAEGLTAAKQFSDAGKSVFDLLGGAVTALAALGDPSFTMPSEVRMDAFQRFIARVVQQMVDTAALFTSDGLDAAKQFADTGKAIFDLLGDATKFDGLPDIGAHFAQQFAGFLTHVKEAVVLLIEVGDELGKGLDQAVDIAKKVSTIVGLLTNNSGGGAGTGAGGTGGGGAGSGGKGGFGGGHIHNKGGFVPGGLIPALIAPTIALGGGNGGALTGANSPVYSIANPLPVMVVAGRAGTPTITINTKSDRPADIANAVNTVLRAMGRDLALEGF